ncbi:MAG: DNA gyrase inhibitor YacG [Phycisphaerae bacterium]|jgi:hypothetical protein
MPILECSHCRRQVVYSDLQEVPYRPFCSKRCQLIDLGKWLNEEYRVSEEIPPELMPQDAPAAGRPNQTVHPDEPDDRR